jgi:hypothetical protein
MWKCQVRKLNSGPSPATRTRLLSFNKTQTKVINGLVLLLKALIFMTGEILVTSVDLRSYTQHYNAPPDLIVSNSCTISRTLDVVR